MATVEFDSTFWFIDRNYRWAQGREEGKWPEIPTGTFLVSPEDLLPADYPRPESRDLLVGPYSGLFLELADTEPSPEGILQFARNYGWLGGRALTKVILDEPSAGEADYGEPYPAWVIEIEAMRAAVQLWECRRASDEAVALSRIQSVQSAMYSYHQYPMAIQLPVPVNNLPGIVLWGDVYSTSDLSQRVRAILEVVVNGNLRNSSFPQLSAQSTDNGLGLSLVPSDLLGAVWCQFALAITKDSDFRRCNECGRWFEVTQKVARSDKQYCSNACRNKAYRKRQAEAKRLDVEGVSTEEIARRLSTDVRTAARWIRYKRGRADNER